MKTFFESVAALVLFVVASLCLYAPYLYYTQGSIGFPLFLLGCLPAWVVLALMDNGNGKALPFRFKFWAVVLLIWFPALFYINANFEGELYYGLVIVHFFSVWVAVYVGDVLDFRLTRRRTKREIKQSTDVDWLRSRYLDPAWIAPELRKAAQKRILALNPSADVTPNPPKDSGFVTNTSLSFTDDILTPLEKSNGEAILFEKPEKAFIKGTFTGVFLICFVVAIIAIVIGNYTLEQQGPHSPAYQVGKAIPPFLSQNSYLLILPFLVSAVASWHLIYKPTQSGIVKKRIVFSGNLQPQQLDALTMQRVGLRWRPAHGNTLTIYRDFNLDTMVAEKGHAVVYFNDDPAPQRQPEPPKAKPEPEQTKPKPKAPRKPKPKPAPKTDDEAVFERRVFDDPDEEKPKAKVRVEPEPKDKGGNSRREKLEALANDPNAPPNVRIAALTKLQKMDDD